MFDFGVKPLDWRSPLTIKDTNRLINRAFHPTSVYAIVSPMTWAVAIIAVLGVLNFAMHRAVLERGHPLVEQMPEFLALLGGRLTLVAEFAVLLFAMLLAANGWSELAWAYLAYSVLNGMAAWLIVSGRV